MSDEDMGDGSGSSMIGTPLNEGAGDGRTRGFTGAVRNAMCDWLGNDCEHVEGPPAPPAPSLIPPSASLHAPGVGACPVGLVACCWARGGGEAP